MPQQAEQAPIIVEPKVYELPSAEQHIATITRVDDLGIVDSKMYGKQHKVRFVYTLEDQRDSKGEEMQVFETMAASIGEKSRLGKRLRSIGVDTSKALDITEVKGFRVYLGIIHNKQGDKTYANVDYVSRIKRPVVTSGTPAPEAAPAAKVVAEEV